MHKLEDGAKRYIDALLDEDTYKSGVFYASKKGTVAGPVRDQSKYYDVLKDQRYQENAYTALEQVFTRQGVVA